MERPERFTSQPFGAEAIKVTLENIFETAAWCGGEVTHRNDPDVHIVLKARHNKAVRPGEWIVKLDNGGYRIYPEKLFRQVFVPKKHSSAKFEAVLSEVRTAMTKQDTATYLDKPKIVEGVAVEITENILKIF